MNTQPAGSGTTLAQLNEIKRQELLADLYSQVNAEYDEVEDPDPYLKLALLQKYGITDAMLQ